VKTGIIAGGVGKIEYGSTRKSHFRRKPKGGQSGKRRGRQPSYCLGEESIAKKKRTLNHKVAKSPRGFNIRQ